MLIDLIESVSVGVSAFVAAATLVLSAFWARRSWENHQVSKDTSELIQVYTFFLDRTSALYDVQMFNIKFHRGLVDGDNVADATVVDKLADAIGLFKRLNDLMYVARNVQLLVGARLDHLKKIKGSRKNLSGFNDYVDLLENTQNHINRIFREAKSGLNSLVENHDLLSERLSKSTGRSPVLLKDNPEISGWLDRK